MFTVLTYTTTSALSIVYNFRIAQTTRQPIVEETEKKPNTLGTLLFDLYQKTHAFDIRENYTGGLATFNHLFTQKYYVRADLAAAHTYQTVQNLVTVNETEPDDLLVTAGRNFKISKKSKCTLSGLFGIPTHSVNTLQRVGFGSGQVGIGTQIDGLYKMTKNVDFLWGARYNYFVPRTAIGLLGNSYKFTIGSIADILIVLQTSRALSHGVEGGYDARWGFGVKSSPTIPNLGLLNYMRNSFYLLYKYSFLTERVAHRCMLNIAYGFDVKPKLYGYNAIMVWGSWGIAF